MSKVKIDKWWKLTEPNYPGRRAVAKALGVEAEGIGKYLRGERWVESGKLLPVPQPVVSREYLLALGRGAPPDELIGIAEGSKKALEATGEATKALHSKTSSTDPEPLPSEKSELAGEDNLLELFVCNPDLVKSFLRQARIRGWTSGSYLRPGQLLWDYICTGRKGCPPPSVIRPRPLDHTYFAANLSSDIAVHTFFPAWKRHPRGMIVLRGALRPYGFNPDLPREEQRVDLLKGKSGQPGYIEARKFLAGQLMPSMSFFQRLEKAANAAAGEA